MSDIMTIEDDNFIIGGSIGILDLGNVIRDHFFQADILSELMKKLTRLSVEAQPYKVVSFHYINVPDSFEAIFNLIKGFMSEEYKSKVNIILINKKKTAVLIRFLIIIIVLCTQKHGIIVQIYSTKYTATRVWWRIRNNTGAHRLLGKENSYV